MSLLSTLRPTTLEGVKSLARQIRKRDGIAHHEALDAASRQAGYENFRHAQNSFSPPRPKGK